MKMPTQCDLFRKMSLFFSVQLIRPFRKTSLTIQNLLVDHIPGWGGGGGRGGGNDYGGNFEVAL